MEIDLRLLQCALKLAEHRNFARAAKALHMSQPSLSRNIQDLEHRLETKLFLRSQQGVEPTAAGVILLEHANEVIGRAADLVREMNHLRGLQKGELSIGAGIYPGPMFVHNAIARLVRDHPAVSLSISYDNAFDLLPRILQREFDLAVIYYAASSVNREIEVTRLKRHQIYFAVRPEHPLLRVRRGLSLTDVMDYPLATTGRLPASLLKRLRAAMRRPRAKAAANSIPGIGCESLTMIRNIVAGSDTVGVFPLNVLLPEVQEGKLVALPLVESWLTPDFAIIHLKNRNLSPLGLELKRLIVESDALLQKWEADSARLLFENGLRRTRNHTKLPVGRD